MAVTGRRLIRLSIRARLTAVATVVVAAVLTASAVGLVLLQRIQLTTSLDHSLVQSADAFSESLARTTQLGVIPNTSDDHAGQLVSATGDVVAATPNLAGEPALSDPLATGQRQTILTRRDLPLPDDTYRVLTRRVDTPDGPAVLQLAESRDDLKDVLRALTLTLAGAIPLVVALLAGLIWWLVGRSLRPVEAIRSEVADIGGADLGRRVPVPSGDDEITHLASTMNQMLDRISAAVERQRQFVADASHELRTPLTRIRTEVEVDLSQPERADHEATNRAVLQETGALAQLIDDLLHLARSDADAGGHSRQPVDLDDIVLGEIRRERAGTAVEIDSSHVSAAHLEGDPEQLGRVVRNLLTNAIRHTATRVTLTLQETTGGIELTVADDGPGVPPEAQERIFERFGRVEDARTRDHGGTGLGLAIVKDIVEHHGGTIAYDASWAGGARLVVSLPAGGDL